MRLRLNFFQENNEKIKYKNLDELYYLVLKEKWDEIENIIIDEGLSFKEYLDYIIDKKISVENIVDAGICPTCFDKENGHILYGDNKNKMIYEDENFECFLVGNPRAHGHVAISTKKHYKDMMKIDDEICTKIFVLAKKIMNIIKETYKSESVYLCTMCDGPMNHFHIQLIPRYSNELRGSKNFAKPRFEYVEDKEKIEELRKKSTFLCYNSHMTRIPVYIRKRGKK